MTRAIAAGTHFRAVDTRLQRGSPHCPVKSLPRTQRVLETLLHTATSFLDLAEPLTRQLDQLCDELGRTAGGTVTDRSTVDLLQEEIRRRLARSSLGDSLILPYLARPSARDLPPEFASILTAIASSPKPPAVIAEAIRETNELAAMVQEVRHRVRAAQRLQHQIIDALEAIAQPPSPAEPGCEPIPVAETTGPPGAAGAGRRQRQPAGVAPSRLNEWGIALDEKHNWQVFRRVAGRWRHEKQLPLPHRKNCWPATLLGALLEGKGEMKRDSLVTLVHRHLSYDERKRVFRSAVTPAISRLRATLRQALELPPKAEPLAWDPITQSYHLKIAVGLVERGDDGRTGFSPI